MNDMKFMIKVIGILVYTIDEYVICFQNMIKYFHICMHPGSEESRR